MEISLTRQAGTRVAVTCDDQPSHEFDLLTLVPDKNVEDRPPHPLEDATAYGQAIHQALFPPNTPAGRALSARPGRILLVATDDDLQAVPWEYAHAPDGFVVLDCHFVRGLPAARRTDPPTPERGLHIVAVPSNPLDRDVQALNIDGEWLRLTEAIEGVSYGVRLERTRPPTLGQLRNLVAPRQNLVVHFMGHGGQHATGAVLFFERAHGGLHPVTARDFMRRVKDTVFLVTLNACVSATPGPTEFSNLAAALMGQGMPYALGMQFLVVDEDGGERRVLWLTVQVRHREGHTTDLAWPVALPAWLELN